MANLSDLTNCGSPGIDRIPFGTHACHFYRDREQLLAALVPYFLAGLRGNERCLWIAAPPLPARDAVQAMRAASGRADDAIRAGALRILDVDEWYESSDGLKGADVIPLWLEEEERALADGYNGLRISGSTSLLAPGEWSTVMEYERAVTTRFNGRRIVTLCSYAMAECNERQMSNVVDVHHCAFEPSGTDSPTVAVSGALPEPLSEGQQDRQAMVLIVDDDPDVCDVIAASLSGRDFRIECAYSAEEALERLAAGRIDVALVDLLLARRQGLELGKRLAAAGVAVIMMSGALDAEERLAGTGFKLLRKPFRLETLVGMVRDSLCDRVAA